MIKRKVNEKGKIVQYRQVTYLVKMFMALLLKDQTGRDETKFPQLFQACW